MSEVDGAENIRLYGWAESGLKMEKIGDYKHSEHVHVYQVEVGRLEFIHYKVMYWQVIEAKPMR